MDTISAQSASMFPALGARTTDLLSTCWELTQTAPVVQSDYSARSQSTLAEPFDRRKSYPFP
jgi:hypothetical protein